MHPWFRIKLSSCCCVSNPNTLQNLASFSHHVRAEADCRCLRDWPVVVCLPLPLLCLPAESPPVGQHGGSHGRPVVASPPNQHHPHPGDGPAGAEGQTGRPGGHLRDCRDLFFLKNIRVREIEGRKRVPQRCRNYFSSISSTTNLELQQLQETWPRKVRAWETPESSSYPATIEAAATTSAAAKNNSNNSCSSSSSSSENGKNKK